MDTAPPASPAAPRGAVDELDQERLHALIPRLRRFARALTREPAAADDLVQAALERALRAWASRRREGALQPWLFSILYRQFVDERRRAQRWQAVLDVLGVAADAHAPSAERVAEGRDALARFAALPVEQRAVLMLVTVEGLSYREAAEALGLPVGTVMSRLSRGRDRMRQLADEHPAPVPLRLLK